MSGKPRESRASETGLKQLLSDMRSELVRFMLSRNCYPADVEDLVQDLFVKLSAVPSGPISNPRAYLYQMANNLVHDQRRGRNRQKNRDDHWARNHFGHDLERDPAPSPERIAIDRNELEQVEKALAAMPPRTAEILRKYRVEGQDQKSIASELAISLSAVEKHLQRAYRELIRLRIDLTVGLETHEGEADDVSVS